MSAVVTVSGRAVGRSKPLFADWSAPYPPELESDGGQITLRDLITRIVRAEVEAFRTRQSERKLERVLSRAEVERGAARGKIDSGGRDLQQEVDSEDAVATALQAFEDAIYLVVVDEHQHERLDSEVYLRRDSRVTFLRLALLAGADVPPPEVAAERQRKVEAPGWHELALARLRRLPAESQKLGQKLLGPVKDEAHRYFDVLCRGEVRVVEELASLSEWRRRALFEALLPGMHEEVERGWQAHARLPYRIDSARRPFRAPLASPPQQ